MLEWEARCCYKGALGCLQAFSTWWAWCEEARADKGKMHKVLHRLRSITVGAVLSHWRSETRWGRHLRHMGLQASVHWERGICRSMLRAWVSLVREKQRSHLAVLMKTSALRNQHVELASAFGGWRDNVGELRRQQRILSRAVARMQRRTLSASFQHFRGVVRRRQRGKRIVEAFRGRSRRGTLAEVSDSVFASLYSSVFMLPPACMRRCRFA